MSDPIESLSQRDLKILVCIAASHRYRAVGPHIDEIVRVTGVRSRARIDDSLNALEAAGLITRRRKPGSKRASPGSSTLTPWALRALGYGMREEERVEALEFAA